MAVSALLRGRHGARLVNLQKAQLIGHRPRHPHRAHRSPSRRVAVVMRVEPTGFGSSRPRSGRCEVSRGSRAGPRGFGVLETPPFAVLGKRGCRRKGMTTGQHLLDELRHEHGEGRLVSFLVRHESGGVPRVGRHDRAARTNRREPSGSGNRTRLICTYRETEARSEAGGRVEAGRWCIHAGSRPDRDEGVS
jgi:hypothetical protein